jgi:hypothetical protein
VGKKVNLPLFDRPPADTPAEPAPKPSIDVARARLGGRLTSTDAPGGLAPGSVVTFATATGRRVPGVIVFASAAEVHVLLDPIRLRRLPPSDVAPHEGEVALELEKIAADARLFGLLAPGQPVRYADEAGALIDGKVVEKCRWGALVRRDDGAVVAVGFRKLWPLPSGGSA